jgi:hypothetical protein
MSEQPSKPAGKKRWTVVGFLICVGGIALAVIVPILLQAQRYLFFITPQGTMGINPVPLIALSCWVFLMIPGSIAVLLSRVDSRQEDGL